MKKRITKRAVDALAPRSGQNGNQLPNFLWDTDVTGFGCKVTPTGRKVYILQYRPLDQRSRSTAPKRLTLGRHGELTPDQARTLAAEKLLLIKAGNDPSRPPSDNGATVATLMERFLTEYLPSKKRAPRPRTIEDYERIVRRHILPKLGFRDIEAVTENDIDAVHQAMRKTPYQANRMLAVARQAFTQAERWGYRPANSNPVTHIERYREEKRGTKKEVMLTPAQMRALFNAIDTEERRGTDPYACAAIRFAFWTGWRINSEVLRLQWTNIDVAEGRAKLILTKTADEEHRAVPAAALQVLQGLPRVDGNPYVFPGREFGSHLTTVRKPWVRIRARAGLDDLDGLGALRLHDLRHNVVSWDVSRGVPLKMAGRTVGHRSQQSTEVYAHFAPDALRQAADERAAAMQVALGKGR